MKKAEKHDNRVIATINYLKSNKMKVIGECIYMTDDATYIPISFKVPHHTMYRTYKVPFNESIDIVGIVSINMKNINTNQKHKKTLE